MKNTPSAYLVGPDVFSPDIQAVFRHARAVCTRHRIDGWEPVDGGLSSGALHTAATARAIYQGNETLLVGCTGIIANVMPFRGTEMDSGSAFEIGFAWAMGKPIVGYGGDDGMTYAQRTHAIVGGQVQDGGRQIDDQGLPVENFGLGLPVLVHLALDAWTPTIEDAAAQFAQRVHPPKAVPSPDSIAHGAPVVITLQDIASLADALDLRDAQQQARALVERIRLAGHVTLDAEAFRGSEPSASIALLMGYAVALKKPVDLILKDQREQGVRVSARLPGCEQRAGSLVDRNGWVIENMEYPLNLMLSCAAAHTINPCDLGTTAPQVGVRSVRMG